MVHQHFKLVDVFSAADNIWMGREKSGFALKSQRYEEIGHLVSAYPKFELLEEKYVADDSLLREFIGGCTIEKEG
jgi:simple sugar transport system ATP-binding protein